MGDLVLFRRVAVLFVGAGVFCASGACSSDREILAKEGPGPVFGSDAGEGGAPSAASPDGAVPLCPTAECPEGRVTCPSTPFPCAVDLTSDEENCGACGVRCRQDDAFLQTFHAISTCASSECHLVCAPGYADCNGNVEDGCEVSTLANKDNCGGCGVVCDDLCVGGKCGCGGSATYCPGQGCVSLHMNDDHCGACGHACPPSTKPPLPEAQHAYYGCVAGECDQLKCADGRADCNGDLGDPAGDGCEVEDLQTDPNNCGACGNVCEPGASCYNGKCVCPCGAPCFERLNSDFENCGTCGFVCPGDTRSIYASVQSLGAADPAHGRPICDQGACGYACSPHWDDCDGDISNGCETNILSDPHNCGACGVRCDGVEGQACVNGQCFMKECSDPGATQ